MERWGHHKLITPRRPQSILKLGYCKEAAPAALLNAIFRMVDWDHVSILILLDLSAAFDAVDHLWLLANPWSPPMEWLPPFFWKYHRRLYWVIVCLLDVQTKLLGGWGAMVHQELTNSQLSLSISSDHSFTQNSWKLINYISIDVIPGYFTYFQLHIELLRVLQHCFGK